MTEEQQRILDRSLADALRIARRLSHSSLSHAAWRKVMELVVTLRKLGAKDPDNA